MSVQIPEELYQKVVEMAREQQVSVDEALSSAFAQQISAWERLRERASRGAREKFLASLDRVPDIEPDHYDRR